MAWIQTQPLITSTLSKTNVCTQIPNFHSHEWDSRSVHISPTVISDGQSISEAKRYVAGFVEKQLICAGHMPASGT